jgi:hypothetical protein
MRKTKSLMIKVYFNVILLLLAYYLLELAILKGELFVIEKLLFSLFYLNCFIVGLKILRK